MTDYTPLIASSAQQYGLDPNLLKGVLASESSLQPHATGEVMKDGTTAKGIAQLTDGTARALGVSDPYDPAQAIPAAARLLAQNMQASGGDTTKAIAMYKGGSDPAAWGPKTQAGTQHALQLAGWYAANDAVTNDPVLKLLQGGGQTNSPASAAPQSPTDLVANDPVLKLLNAAPQAPASSNGIDVTVKPGAPAPAEPPGGWQDVPSATSQTKTPTAPSPTIGSTFRNAVSTAFPLYPLGEAALGMAGSVASEVANTVGGIASSMQDGTFGTPQAAYKAGSETTPVGEAIAKATAPQSEMGKKVAELASDAMEKSGLMALGPDLNLAHQAGEAASGSAKRVAAAVPTQEPTITVDPAQPAPAARPTPAQPASVQAPEATKTSPAPSVAPAAARPGSSQTAAVARPGQAPTAPITPLNEPAIDFTPPEAEAPGPDGSRFTPMEQAKRAATLQRIGLDQARASAIAGDVKNAGTDWQTAQLDEPAGRLMGQQIEAEKQALTDHANRIVADTGGTPGLNQEENYQRGQTILAPFDAYRDHFDAQIRAAYQAANDAAAGAPAVSLAPLSDFLDKASNFQGTRASVRDGVRAYLREQGILTKGEDGVETMRDVTPREAEGIRQYANTQWNPDNSRLIGLVKDAVDDAVTQTAGANVYEQARALRAQRGRILDDPKSLARIMDVDPVNPVNRATPIENIPDVVTRSSADQLAHMVKTLNEMPAELQPQAQAAIAEIKAHFANKVAAAGKSTESQWNAKGVTKSLSDNARRLATVFTPEELARFQDLNDAGHILRMRTSYPGAEAQRANFARRGLASVGRAGATAAGVGLGSLMAPLTGHSAPIVGGTIGSAAGEFMTRGVAERGALKATQKRIRTLGDVGR